MITSDFLVVGAGIAGASVAYELATRGSVAVLERESMPGYHTTGRSAAIFHETYGRPPVRRLASASRAFLTSPPDGFAEHPLLAPRGVLMVARTDQRPRLEEARERAADVGPRLEWLDGHGARALVPVLRPAYVAAALYEPDARDVDVHGLHQGFLRGLRARGGRIVTDAEVLSARRVEGVWQVDTGQGRFASGVLVNAAGAWADELARRAGVATVGLQPLRRTIVTVEAPPGVDIRTWPMVMDVDEAFYFKPDAGRILLSPADETPRPPSDVQPDEYDVAVAVDRLHAVTTLTVERILRRWAGLRSFVADRLPVVGYDPAFEGFFWLAGQGGTGIMTSPALGRLAGALAARERPPEDLAGLGVVEALSPARLGGPEGPLSREPA